MQKTATFTRRSFLKSLALAAASAPFVTSGLLASPPLSRLRHASFGTAGMAWADINEIAKFKTVDLIAAADVDLNRTVEFQKRFPHARVYQDWRELLDREHKHIDCVNVSTPDHMHAPIAMAAMELGKHVYVQKPLAHDVHEVRKLTEFARQKKLVSQMGIQIHSTSHYRLAALLIQAGTIGRIKEVHSWCPKSWGDPSPLPERNDPVPETLDWDGWLGVCQDRPFIGGGYYHPVHWRNRLDFGTGTMGDMGCHILDPVFRGLGLSAPVAVRSEGPAPNQWNWAIDSRIEFTFAGSRHAAGPTLKITWYDGAQKPPAEVRALLEGDELPNTGSIFVGTQGALVLPHIARPLLYPDARFKSFQLPEVAGEDHWGQFVQACLGHARTTANFDYSGPLTETVLLGTIATRFPDTTLNWDSRTAHFQQSAANQFVTRQYRQGWKNKNLA